MQGHLAGEPIVQMHHGPVRGERYLGSVLHDRERVSRNLQILGRELHGPDRRRDQCRPIQQVPGLGIDGFRSLYEFDGRADFVPCHPPRHQRIAIGSAHGIQQHLLVLGNAHGRQAGKHSAPDGRLIEERLRSATQGRHPEQRPAGRGVDDGLASGTPGRAGQAETRVFHEHGQHTAAQAELAQAGTGRKTHGIAVRGPKDLSRALCSLHLIRLVAVQRLNPKRAVGAARGESDVAAVR